MSKDIENIIVKHYAGSHAYGTNIETSDVDFRGIFCANKESIITPFFNINEKEDKSEEDTKFYELNNFMKLYLDGNPNVMETLWVDESDIVQNTDEYRHLRKFNQALLSSRIAKKYTGYAHGQITRMTNHHGWMAKERTAIRILQEIVEQYKCEQVIEWVKESFPEFIWNQIDFTSAKGQWVKTFIDFDKFMRNASIQLVSITPPNQSHFVKLVHNYFEHQVLDRDFNIMNYNNGYELIPYGENIFAVVPKENGKCINLSDGSIHKIDTTKRTLADIKQQPKLIVKFNKEEWKLSSDNRKSYHDWKENRNETRSELEKKFGMDTKHAMHTVRLLRTAEEVLETGIIQVKRPDAKELLAIRNGSWSYDEMMQYWEEKSNHIRNVLAKKTNLPSEPDYNLAAKVLIELREMQWYGKK